MKIKNYMKMDEGDVFQKHQLKIAKSTLKMSDAGANIMGGMSKEEARKFLKSIGWNDKKIKKIEEGVETLNEGQMKEVKVDLILSVNPKFGQKSEFRKALKNLLNARGESVLSLKAIKSIDGLV